MSDTSGAPWLKYQQGGTSATPAADANPGPWTKYQTAANPNPPPQEKSVSGEPRERGDVWGQVTDAYQGAKSKLQTDISTFTDPKKNRESIQRGTNPINPIAGDVLGLAAEPVAALYHGTVGDALSYPIEALDKLQGVKPGDYNKPIPGLGGAKLSDPRTAGREVSDIMASGLATPAKGATGAFSMAEELGKAKPFLASPKTPLAVEPKPGVQGMRDAGYVLTPETASEKPGKISSALSGWSGDLKSQQLASVKNQKITQTIAAKDLGLPPDTMLTPDVLNSIRGESGQAYKAARNAVPEIVPTAEFKKATDTFGGDTELLNKHFPKSTENKDVDALRAEMRSMGTVPTDVVVDKIRVLRADATQNFKALGSPEKWRLAMAQRDAANSLDDLLEHNIQNAPKYFEGKIKEAGETATDAQREIAEARSSLEKYRTQGKTFDIPFAEKRLQLAQERLAAAEESKVTHTQRLAEAKDPKSNIANISSEYKKARTRIAKTYDYEAAVNPKTGEISPRALAALVKKGKPLTGGARAIADAALTAPKVMRVPSEFGGAKELSVLDFAGTMGALASHHPAVAGAIVGRPLARHAMLSDTYQNLMVPKSKQILSTLGQTPPDSGEILRVLGQTDAP